MGRRKIKLNILIIATAVLLFGSFVTITATATDTENREIIATGTTSENGAPWTLYDDGMVEVGGGIIYHNGEGGRRGSQSYSLWNDYREHIIKTIFTKPVVAGEELRGRSHVVQWGDTLSELAVQYETTVIELVRLNNIENPDFILVGQILSLPNSKTYQMATVPVRFYRLYDDNGGNFIYECTTVFISGENFATEIVELANEHFSHVHIDVWVVENRIYVNLSPTTHRGLSSHETTTGFHTLLLTFSSVPNINEIVFLNEGRRGGFFGKMQFADDGLYLADGSEIEEIRNQYEIR